MARADNPPQGYGGGGGSSASKFQMNNTLQNDFSNGVYYVNIGGSGLESTAESQRQMTMMIAGTLKKLLIDVQGHNTGTNPVAVTVRINGVDTLLLLSVPVDTTGIFSADVDIAVAEDDLVSVEVDNTGNSGLFRVSDVAISGEYA